MPLPEIEPRYAEARGTTWPGTEWPSAPTPARVAAARDDAFSGGPLGETYATVVVQGGRVVAERYDGTLPSFDGSGPTVTPATPLLSWSMAKSVLHALVGTLVAEGRLDPDAPAPVPEWAGDERSTIRLADLLAMRDGLDWTEVYSVDQESHVVDMLFGAGRADMGAYAAGRPPAHPPDTRFTYSSGTSNIVSRLVADLVGRGDAYREALRTRLFEPLGMTSATPGLDESGVFVASSYVHATALDFARFGLLYLRGGDVDGRSVLARSWCDTAQIPHSADSESDLFYSWHWWVTGDRYGTYCALGYEGQMIAVVPALDAVVVRLGRTPEEQAGPALTAWRESVLESLDAD